MTSYEFEPQPDDPPAVHAKGFWIGPVDADIPEPPATYETVYYMPQLTGGPMVVDDRPGAGARMWQALIDSVDFEQDRQRQRMWEERGWVE